MKRLKLEAFKAKQTQKETTQKLDQLLGQVLGDCHDEPKPRTSSGSNYGGGSSNSNRLYDTP